MNAITRIERKKRTIIAREEMYTFNFFFVLFWCYLVYTVFLFLAPSLNVIRQLLELKFIIYK